MKPMVMLFSLLFLAHSALSAAELKGTVRDAETGESLPGANIYIEGVERGATTDLDGQFAIANVGAGSHTLVVSFIGYKEHRSPVVVEADAVELFVELMPEIFRGKEIIIVADRAKMRETPVAFSDVPKADMQRKLGSRDLPLILNDTPGVYATAQGGGAGDSRINVRGFDQRNVAVMINGVPVNDMENGWVYWSNWDGLSDVTSSIQVQRGLGASNLAIASVGGTMNIITDIASQRRGFKLKQEAGNNAFYKTTLNFSSGLIDKKTAFTVGMTRKSSEGLPAQAWSSAWAYFGALSFLASDTHKIDLFVTGAPQRHGHRLYKQSIATFDADYARSLGIDVADARNYGVNYNPNWGRSPFSSYQEYYNGSVHDARDSAIIMERENFYHKPQANLNWYWTPSAQFMLSNVLYFSRGKGGGTGRLGASPGALADGSINWQRVADELNTQPASEANSDLVDAGEVGADEIAAQTIIRNSVNQHFWYGYLGTAEYHLSDIYKLTFGTDLRYYKGEHWREVRNLLGADYYVFEWDNNATTSVKRLGDRVAYHNDGLTRWGGGFAQLEGQFDKFTAFLSTSGSMTGYKRIDYFRAKVDGDWDQTAWENFPGYTMKVGGNYNATPTVNVYANMGWLSTAPKFDSVYHYDNSLYDPTFNEKVASFELGAGYFKRGMFTGNANFYYTKWIDRSWPKSIYSEELDQSFRFLLNGIDALHTGVELDLKARPHDKFEVRGMVSLGNWEWLNDVDVTFSPEEDPETIGEFQVYAKGLKVGDAAQKTMRLSGAVFPTRGLYASLGVRRFMDHYAKFDPANRTDPDDREQSWKLPDYNLVDLHASYTLPGASFSNMKLRLHVFNLLDERYVSDADDGDGHDAASARVFLGLGRRWNISLSYDY
ncbi:MAG: TonB-dependent receptor [Gemmatimonadetes bacterium]|nr:TonB-dependent receptor [Gemmatimonadota bacterium]